MSTIAKDVGNPSFLASMVLGLALTGAASGQETRLTAETFGRASGDTPHAELGLVLELVDAGTPDARLRLFGGMPGQPATIVVSASKVESAPAPNGAIALVGPAVLSSSGTFDWTGTYELSLDGLELGAGQVLYAQGIHTGILDFGGQGPLVQLSHGLELHGTVEEEQPLWFDDLLPHLPESRDLAGTQGLAEKLQRMLNSAGDEVRIAVEIEITAGLGIEIVDAKAGGKLECEFTVERTEDGLYEVKIGADIAGLAGVSAGTGAEVGLDVSKGYGASRFFRFDSAPGAARGILGMVLALRFPELQPGRFLAGTGILGDAGERVRQLQDAVGFAKDHADELEQLLWDVLDAAVDRAEAVRAKASSNLSVANRNYASAPWWLRPAYWCQVVACQGALNVANAGLTVARTAREQGYAAVQLAKSFLESKKAELLAAVREVARITRLAGSIAQLRGWAAGHDAGFEFRSTSAAEVEAKVKAPVVDMKNFGLSASSEVQQQFVTRWEPATAHRSGRITVRQTLESERKFSAGLILGGEVAHKRTLEVADTFEIGAESNLQIGHEASFTNDVSLVGAIGLIVARETGAGRTCSFKLERERAADLASLFSPADLVERMGAAEIGFELQDRRQENLDVAFAIDVSGNGGGIEIELEWADQGRMLSRSTTVAQGIQTILDGATQVIDVERGTMVEVEP